MKHTREELRQWQALPLIIKVRMTEERIRMWVREYGESGVYVSFSGGKDSTVLLDIVRNKMGLKDIPAVFVDTGLEYPEIRKFVKTFDNVVIVKPKMNFRQIIEKYGYPMFSKEVSEVVSNAKRYLTALAREETISTDRQTLARIGTATIDFADAESIKNPTRGGQTQSTENCVDLVSLAESKDKFEMPYHVSVLLGKFETYWQKKKMGIIPKDGEPSRAKYSQEKYKFMLNAPFNISNKCCQVMKKNPLHQYAHESGRVCMTAEMAEESALRTQKWLRNGCNGFHLNEPKSTPMAFWTEQDILQYIREYDIPIASVYGEIVVDEHKSENIKGQLQFGENGIEETKCVLKTTGCKRTGCMFCGFGCHLEKPGEGRYERMKITHPKIYDYIMRPWESEIEMINPKTGKTFKRKKRKIQGLNFKEVIDWINENGNMNIRY